MKLPRRDLWSVLAVLSAVMAMATVFPYASLRFRGREPSRSPASAAFVTLTEAEEGAALQAAKTAWQVASSNFRRLRAELSVASLPEHRYGPVMPRPDGSAGGEREVFHAAPVAYPATRGAPPPRQIAVEPPPARPLTFSRDELLSID